ncbi:MAG TPA: hypothetical protein VM889_15030 [Candidatus Thermoplasmatota archaeon]|nr:hypothetical protein [Candidatus Thermoplasmatota archaeon]
MHLDAAAQRGLLLAVGKHLAALPLAERVPERLEAAEDPEALRHVLEDLPLGIEPPAAAAFIADVTGPAWRDRRAELARTTREMSHELRSPGS